MCGLRRLGTCMGGNVFIHQPFDKPGSKRRLSFTGEIGNDTAFMDPNPVPPAPACRLKFWGVRGSVPTPGPSTVSYGGNTSCIEVRADDEIIVLDAGTGIRPLGLALAAEFGQQPINLTLLISHTHWDHIQGFPYFTPAYNSRNHVRILGYEGARHGLANTLAGQMESSYFPVALTEMPGSIAIEELQRMEFSIGRVEVRSMIVNHPGVVVGYRLFTSGGSIAYVPDNEPFGREGGSHHPDPNIELASAENENRQLVEFIREADILVIDAQYEQAEYDAHVGWGHGCVDDVVRLAIAGNVKHCFLFHHDPNHDDERVALMLAHARALAEAHNSPIRIDAAREGEEVLLKKQAP